MCFLSSGHRGKRIGCLLVVSIGMFTVGLRGTSMLGYSLLLGEEITRHLQLPFISHRVRLEPNEKPVGGFCPVLWKYKKTETNVFQPSSTKVCPFTASNMRVQIDLVHSPPQPNHLFSLKTDSFMCCYHVIMCCCSAGSYSISETFTCRHKGWRRRRVERKGGEVVSFFYGVQNTPIMAPTFSLPLFSLCLFCVSDFHEKALNRISHLRNTSVRWCQRLAYSSSCWVANMACSHGRGMLTRLSGQRQTQVGSRGKHWRAFCPRLHFGGDGRAPRSNLLSLWLCKFRKGGWWR